LAAKAATPQPGTCRASTPQAICAGWGGCFGSDEC
jgi:hypothetical protein